MTKPTPRNAGIAKRALAIAGGASLISAIISLRLWRHEYFSWNRSCAHVFAPTELQCIPLSVLGICAIASGVVALVASIVALVAALRTRATDS